jgi:hypothetical protein
MNPPQLRPAGSRSLQLALRSMLLTGYIMPDPFVGLLKLSKSARESSLLIPAKAALNASRVALPPPPPRPRPRPRDIV